MAHRAPRHWRHRAARGRGGAQGGRAAGFDRHRALSGSPVLISAGGDEGEITANTSAGGKAVVVRGGQIMLLDAKTSTALGPLPSGLPAESVLSAVAAAWAAKVPPPSIIAGLKSFGDGRR